MSDLQIAELHEGLAHIMGSPGDEGRVELIALRPEIDRREVVSAARIEPGRGVVGDSWSARRNPSPEAEVTVMNARCIALIAGDVDRWPLAGDQLYVDLDLSERNLPAGSRLRLGSAVVDVSSKPHRGCSKFSARFGADARGFVDSEEGRALRLRGLNARVVEGGVVRTGDLATKA
ncbi:MAG: MOSC domain-containing protein [Actinomycetota bacterium]